MRTGIVVGSRGSRLALIQAESVAAKFKEINPHLEVSIARIVTEGDRNRHIPLERVAGAGIFVKKLEEALIEGRIDIAVHSLKDVPTEVPDGLRLLAVTERLDPRDVQVSRAGGLDELAPGSRIGTGSLRRAAQLTQYRPDLKACGIRGNVDTRLRMVSSGQVDGVIVAAAALLRLGWEDRIAQYLPLPHFLPAVGQGALVVEARLDDKEVAGLVLPINHPPTRHSIVAERAFLRALGGGCRAPIAALGTLNGTILRLDGMIASVSGEKVLYASEEGSAVSPEEVGVRLAQKLLRMGASDFIAEARLK